MRQQKMINNDGFKSYANKLILFNVKIKVIKILSVIKIMTKIIMITHQI